MVRKFKYETEFKGKSLETGEWVYGDLVGGRYIVESALSVEPCDTFDINDYRYNLQSLIGNIVEVDPRTASQYIGRKDREGAKIFGGDICKSWYPNGRLIDDDLVAQFLNGKFVCANGYRTANFDDILITGSVFDNLSKIEDIQRIKSHKEFKNAHDDSHPLLYDAIVNTIALDLGLEVSFVTRVVKGVVSC